MVRLLNAVAGIACADAPLKLMVVFVLVNVPLLFHVPPTLIVTAVEAFIVPVPLLFRLPNISAELPKDQAPVPLKVMLLNAP